MGQSWLRILVAAVCLAALTLVVSAQPQGGGKRRAAAAGLRAVVSIAPLKSLVAGCLAAAPERLGGGAAVEILVPPGSSEHATDIPPSRMAALARADLVVYVGLGLEPAVEKFLRDHPRDERRVVCFAEAAGVHTEAAHHDHDHEHGEDCDHPHGSTDPHLWLDPVLVQRPIDAIGSALADGLTPEESAAWQRAIGERKAEVQRIDTLYRERLGSVKRRTVVVGHDAWGRLAERYGLTTVAIKGLTASEPTPAAIQAAIDAVKREGLTTVFVEPQLSQAAGRRIAEATGTKVAVLDPLGDGDWSKMMEKNLEALVAALSD